MRTIALVAVLAVPFLVCVSCKPKENAGADAAASAAPAAPSAPSGVASVSAAPAAPPAPVRPVQHGPAIAGNGCSPGADSVGCAPDGFEELTCAGGVWRVLQTCRGPGGCKGSGAGLKCEVGALQAGDACMPANTPAVCARRQALHSCIGSKWTESLCPPPSFCHPGQGGAPAACK